MKNGKLSSHTTGTNRRFFTKEAAKKFLKKTGYTYVAKYKSGIAKYQRKSKGKIESIAALGRNDDDVNELRRRSLKYNWSIAKINREYKKCRLWLVVIFKSKKNG